MKIVRSLAWALALMASATAHSAVVFSTDTVEPTADLMLSNRLGEATGQRARMNASNTTLAPLQGIGQTFTVPDAGSAATQWELRRLTLQKLTSQTAGVGSKLSLWLFEFNPSNAADDPTQWNKNLKAIGSDPFENTGITNVPINKAEIDIGGVTFADKQFLHFAFPTPVRLDEEKAYAFYLEFSGSQTGIADTLKHPFDLGSPANASSTMPNGTYINRSAGGNGAYDLQDLTLYLQATPVPEPGAIGLFAVLAMLGLGKRRRRGRTDQ